MQEPEIPYGDLTVGDKLGEGSFAEVYRGQWHQPNGERRAVAIKQLSASVPPDARHELQKEVTAWRALPPHPNVVQLFGWGYNQQANFFMVLELVPQGSLYHYLHKTAEGKQLTFEQRLHLARSTTAGLQHLHRHRVLHGDFKTANLLLADDGAGGLMVKVTDFGLSKSREKSTYTMSQPGSAAYVSPEQMHLGKGAEPVRVSSDIFALSTVLFEVFSGQEPWKDEDDGTIMMFVGNGTEEVVPLPGMDDLPAAVRQLVERCRCKNPQQRPTCQQVLDELDSMGASVQTCLQAVTATAPGCTRLTLGLLVGATLLLLCVCPLLKCRLRTRDKRGIGTRPEQA